MKKIISTAFILSIIATTGFSQGFYLRAGLGYAIQQAGQTLDGTATPYNGTLNATTNQYNIKSASFSAGLGGVLGVGYMFSEHVGVQLDGNLGLSAKQYTFTENNYDYGGVPSAVSITQQARSPFILIPSLVIQSGGDKINLYCRMGVALPLSTAINEDQVIDNEPGTGAASDIDFNIHIKNSFSLGFAAAAGVRYNINDRVNVWGEINLLSLSVYIKETDVESFTYNGQPQSLSSLTGPLTTKYSKNVIADSNGYNSPAYSQPFSNVGINVGVSFNLSHGNSHSGKKHDDEDIDPNQPFRRR